MGTIREADVPTIFILRLGIAGEEIAEIETLVIRNQMAADNLDRVAKPRAAWSEAVPAGARMSRADLVRIANMYFSGIERNDGKGVYPISKTCARLENGSVTAGDPALVPGDAAAATGRGGARIGCLQQFQSGVFYHVTRIRDRRFVAVDPERGLAFAFAFFDNALKTVLVSRRHHPLSGCSSQRPHARLGAQRVWLAQMWYPSRSPEGTWSGSRLVSAARSVRWRVTA